MENLDTAENTETTEKPEKIEKRKLLLVAIAVGVFLIIAAGAAILVFNPQKPAVVTDRKFPEAPASQTGISSRSATTDATDLLKSEELRGLQNEGAPSPIQENRIVLKEAEKPQISVKAEDATKTEAKPQTKPKQSAQPQAKPAPKADAPKPEAEKKAAEAKPKQQPAVAKTSAKKLGKDYWVQAGSFSSRDRADVVKKTLDEKGITAIITNQEINSQTMYRVRIGPYTSQNEADYWLAMVKSINGFEKSQVWETQSMR